MPDSGFGLPVWVAGPEEVVNHTSQATNRSKPRDQIDAVHDLGLTDWVLWNASGRYPAGAFLPNRAARNLTDVGRSEDPLAAASQRVRARRWAATR